MSDECRCLKGQRCLPCIERDGLTAAPAPERGEELAAALVSDEVALD